MGVLDRQSLPSSLENRRIGSKRVARRKEARARLGSVTGEMPVPRYRRLGETTGSFEALRAGASGERRRPGRGWSSDEPTLEPETPAPFAKEGAGAFDLGVFARGLAHLLALPLLPLFLIVRPGQSMRSIRAMPGRFRAYTRRLGMASRDRETAAGRVREGLLLSGHFVQEELRDMADGFPRPEELGRAVAGLVRDGFLWFAHRVGLSDRRRQASSGLILEAVGLGLVAGIATIGLFVSTYQGLESLKTNDRLALRDFKVEGLDRIDRELLRSAMGVGIGDNLLEMDPRAQADSALELPWVDRIEVRRGLADQSLEVKVVEHRPVLILADGDLRLVSDRGVVFKPLDAADPVDLPLLTGMSASASREELVAGTAAALDALHGLRQGDALRASDVSEIRYEGEDGLVVVTRAGLPVRLGTGDFAGRLQRLERAAASGSLPLDALALVDLGLRDRLVAVPLEARRARRSVARSVATQPVSSVQRARMLHLDRARAEAETGAGQVSDAGGTL